MMKLLPAPIPYLWMVNAFDRLSKRTGLICISTSTMRNEYAMRLLPVFVPCLHSNYECSNLYDKTTVTVPKVGIL